MSHFLVQVITMVVWREHHYEAKQDALSVERVAVDPMVVALRQRLESMGLLKFMSVRYLRTQSTLLSQLVGLWWTVKEGGYFKF